MSRLFENFHNGTITDNPLSSGATTINSSEFADLPVVASPDTIFIVLDPLGVDGQPEIVLVTGHVASSTSITVTRGEQTAQNGSAARAHNSGTAWRWTLTAGDILSTAVGRVSAAGDLFYGIDTRTIDNLPIGTANQVLAVNSGATAPEWVEHTATGTISPANANFTIDAPVTVLRLPGGLLVASTTIRKVAGGALTPPGTIATIPAGFRPSAGLNETPQVLVGSGTPALVNVESDGDVTLQVIEGGGTFVAGAAVSFQATWRI